MSDDSQYKPALNGAPPDSDIDEMDERLGWKEPVAPVQKRNLDEHEFLVRLLSKLVGGELDPMRVGQRVIAIAYLAKVPELAGLTQRELAKRMVVSEGNISKMLSATKVFLQR